LPSFFRGLRLPDTGGSQERHQLADEFEALRIAIDPGRVDYNLVDGGACGFDRPWVVAACQGGLQVVHARGIGLGDVAMERRRGRTRRAVWIVQLVTQRLEFGKFGHDRRARAPIANRVDQVVDLAIEGGPLPWTRFDCRLRFARAAAVAAASAPMDAPSDS
jgi:hypothetical protein